MTIRRALTRFHRWIGVTFGLFLIVQGMTGASMIYRDGLNRALHGAAMNVAPAGRRLSAQALLDRVRATHPQGRIVRIEYPEDAREAFLFRLQDHGATMRYVAVDPFDGRITRDGGLASWPVQWLFELHHAVLLGDTGEQIVGVVGSALLLLAITGPFAWWPGRSRLRAGFRTELRGGRFRAVRDVHRVAGICLALVLATIGFTGICMTWKPELQPLVGRIAAVRPKPAPKVAEQAGRALLPLDRLTAAAQARFGGAAIRNVRFPGGTGRVVNIYLEARDQARPRASNQIWLDGYTGRDLGRYEAASLPAGNRFFDWMLPIHSGEALGPLGRILFLVAGLALPAFGLSGLWLWWTRRRLARATADDPGEFDAVVARAWMETPTVRAVELRRPDGGRLPAFAAGAHIDVRLPDQTVRQYSLWNDPDERHRYAIAVQLEPNSRGGSAAIHALADGALLRIRGPRNAFALVEDAPASLLVAGGIGITPVLAMAARLHRLGRPFTVHYCVRGRDRAALLGELMGAPWSDRVVLHLDGSNAVDCFDARSVLRRQPAGGHLYVCGPPRLVETVLEVGRSLHWSEDRMHVERFAPQALGDAETGFRIRLARSDMTLEVAAHQAVSEVLAQAGIPLPTSCGQGLCGTCVVRVLEGAPDHRDRCLTEEERRVGGMFTPCCSRAASALLVLDL